MDQLSIYLDCADSVQLPSGWTRFAHFNLVVVNQFEPKMSVWKGTDSSGLFLCILGLVSCLCCDPFKCGISRDLTDPVPIHVQTLNTSSMPEKVIGVSHRSCHYMNYMIHRKDSW